MIFRCGFSRRLGPVSLMDDEEVYLNRHETRMVANLSVEMGAIAQQEIRDLLDGAEAKAYYALVSNYKVIIPSPPIPCDSFFGAYHKPDYSLFDATRFFSHRTE
jgi:hypothetical protein